MNRLASLSTRILQVFGIMGVFLSACNQISTQGSGNNCSANSASILIYAGGMQRTCGCAESSGISYGVGQQMACTIKVGTTVYFYYSDVNGDHQLSVQGQQQAYQAHGPHTGNPNANGVDIYNATSTGDITFNDTYTGFTGIFHVTP